MRYCLNVVWLLLLVFSNAAKENDKVLVISVDGLPAHFFNQTLMPLTWKAVVEEGRGQYQPMTSCFPTETIPNHWSMAVGKPPSQHGIWARRFWDKNLHELFDAVKIDPKWWSQAEPIWHAARRLGDKSTGVKYWVGSQCPLWPPSELIPYSKLTESPAEIAEHAINWLQKHDLVMTYIVHLDYYFHTAGRESNAFRQALKEVDAALAQAIAQLPSSTNLLIVSDHGMAKVTKSIPLSSLMSPETLQNCIVPTGGPVTFIYLKDTNGKRQSQYVSVELVLEELTNSIQELQLEEHLKVYTPETAPPEYQMLNPNENNPVKGRVPDIILESIAVGLEVGGGGYLETHGWSPFAPEMQAIVIGVGQNYQKQHRQKANLPSHNTELYGVICELLEILDDR